MSAAGDFLDALFERVEHGDAEHRRWLRGELDKAVPDLERALLAAQAAAWREAIDLLVKFDHHSAALLLTKENGVARIGR